MSIFIYNPINPFNCPSLPFANFHIGIYIRKVRTFYFREIEDFISVMSPQIFSLLSDYRSPNMFPINQNLFQRIQWFCKNCVLMYVVFIFYFRQRKNADLFIYWIIYTISFNVSLICFVHIWRFFYFIYLVKGERPLLGD